MLRGVRWRRPSPHGSKLGRWPPISCSMPPIIGGCNRLSPAWRCAASACRGGGYGGLMPSPILLCTDGSDQSMGALSLGLDLLGHSNELVLVTVASGPDPASLVGSGHAGPDMIPMEYDASVEQANRNADSVIRQAQKALGIAGTQTRVLQGDPGAVICQLATELSARAIVVGTRGRGGLKRALLGSVSDYVVRNAPCSVIVTKGESPH
jgi:nucleotide-binding universal stress UspA family protein